MHQPNSQIFSERGSILVEALIGFVIAGIAFMIFSGSMIKSRKTAAALQQKWIAENYASELVETFRAFTDDQLKAYLSTNPVSSSKKPYFLCSHINVLDRANNVLVNRDDIAALPSGNSLSSPVRGGAASRYYQVWVINWKTLQLRSDLCGNTAADISLANRGGSGIVLSPDEKLFVTVGVTWLPAGETDPKNVQTVVASSLLPDAH